MSHFEYDITVHGSEEYQKVVYFCSGNGECVVDEVPGVQPSILKSVLNERGEQGWELVQLSFGKDGIMAFWKRFVT